MHEVASSISPQEHSLQQLFDSFHQNLQTDFKAIISKFKADIQALVSRTNDVEKKRLRTYLRRFWILRIVLDATTSV